MGAAGGTGGGERGLAFPRDATGRRSSTAAGRGAVAAALRPVDPVGALAAERETAWRSGYVLHVRRLLEAGLVSRAAWLDVARAGLAAVRDGLVVVDEDGERPATALLDEAPVAGLRTAEVAGAGEPQRELVVPHRGRELRGADLLAQLDDWTRRGVLEPSAAAAVREVAANPRWLALPGQAVAVLGAGAELGPVAPLLGWGATVAAVDLPRPALWQRLVATARTSGGRLLVPVRDGAPLDDASPGRTAFDRTAFDRTAFDHNTLAAGADLRAQVPAVATWLAGLDQRLVVASSLYADGAAHALVSAAADLLTTRLQRDRPDLALAFLGTPTDVYAVPREVVDASVRAYAARSPAARWLGRPLRAASRGRLLRRNYRPGADPGVCDALVPVQGPNYALAKRIQRWRAAVAREDGLPVSFHVAPASRTRSVLRNRALTAAYAGAHRFGVEVFDPRTANVLMAALLVHDLHDLHDPHGADGGRAPAHAHPWQDEAHGAVHGGLWRSAYAPRSALGLAALIGYAGR